MEIDLIQYPAHRMHRGTATIGAILVVLFFGGSAVHAQTARQLSCSSPEYRQFDFWVGDWDAFEVTDLKTSAAHLRIEKVLNGCVLKETYEGANGVEGQSFSIFDRIRGVWHQSWVTSRGQLLTIAGNMQDGRWC